MKQKTAVSIKKTLRFFYLIKQSGEKSYIIPPHAAHSGSTHRHFGLSSFFSTITHSVVKNMPAIEAAFSRATRVTLAGSTHRLHAGSHKHRYGHCNRSLPCLRVLSVQQQHLLYQRWQQSGATVLQ